MYPFKPAAFRLRKTVLGLVPLLALGAAPALAGPTVTLRFEPPAIEAQPICALRAPDGDVIARWDAWQGDSLEGLDPGVVQREMRRLRELDAARWYDKIDAAITLFPAISPGFTEEKATLERIDLMLAAGRLKELQALGLVDRLLSASAGASPRTKLALSRLLRRGQGVAADVPRGLDLLVEAAFGGNADAILEIVSLQLAGQSVPGWDVAPELAVSMAFGALVGQLDPMICDRVTRIAREYKNGDVVTRDMQLAERWYRFAADLGDVDAAWKVAELHLRAEDLEKDNETLVRYLSLAAERGSPFMALAYGRLYENGALVPRDMDRAGAIYAGAAATGDRGALVRQAQFLTARLRDRLDPPDAAARSAMEAQLQSALQALVQRDDAPAWALTAMAERVLADKGRWAGAAEAEVYLERAAALGDGLARQMLAAMRLTPDMSLEQFYQQIDVMIETIRGEGMVDPMADLQDAFTCRAPDAPRLGEAAHWRKVELGTGTLTVSYSYAELEALAADPDPIEVGRLQTQALYGRPTAMAQYLVYLELAGASEGQREFWEAMAAKVEKVTASLARLYIQSGRPELTGRARTLLEAAVASGDRSAELVYAGLLLQGQPGPTDDDRARALALVLPHAERGNGTALRLLPLADPARWPDSAAVAAEFRTAIDAGGDFDAMILALPHLPDRQAVYLARATTVTTCTFEEAAALLDALAEADDTAGFARWARIAEALAGEDGWRMTALADLLVRYGADADEPRALALYEKAWGQGFMTAGLRLLSKASDVQGRRFDPAQAADLYASLVELADARQLVALLGRLRSEDAAILALLDGRIDAARLYRRAAEQGEAVAMREYGLIVLAGAGSADAAAEAAHWLARAAEAGDGRAMVEYAQLLALGIGVAASREEALVWLERAANLGIEEAAILTRTLHLTAAETQ